MKCFLFTISIFLTLLLCTSTTAQNSSIELDITQSTICNPILIYNKFSTINERNRIRYWQIGIGASLKAWNQYSNFGFEDQYYYENYSDYISITSYNGIQFRFGYFIGKVFRYADSKHAFNRICYLGVGSNLKLVGNNNMHVDYEWNNHDLISEWKYRIQSEKSIIISPFFNSGIFLYKNQLNAEWYSGFQCVIKFRDKHISEDYRLNTSTNKIEDIGPYKEKEINILPTIVVGFRIGLFFKGMNKESYECYSDN